MSQTLTKSTDQRITLPGTWAKFKLMQQVSEESPNIRPAFYNGEIEILMPGREHAGFVCMIGALLLISRARQGIFFQPAGSMTQQKEGEVSVQADQSFCLGSIKPIPDLSIEVIFTSGGESKDCGLNNLWGGCLTRPNGQDAHPTKITVYLILIPKLSLYRALGVPEVWFWQEGVLTLHHLRAGGYERIARSELPE